MSDPLAWQDDAKCRSGLYDPELWFTEAPGKSHDRTYAKAICGMCPVQASCLAFAMAHETGSHWHRFGIYGGHTPNERAALARKGNVA